MHLVRISEKKIWDLDGDRAYELIEVANHTVTNQTMLVIRVGHIVTGDNSFSDFGSTGDYPANFEEVLLSNRRTEAFWEHLKSQCKFDAVSDAKPYRFTDKGIPGILVDLKD